MGTNTLKHKVVSIYGSSGIILWILMTLLERNDDL